MYYLYLRLPDVFHKTDRFFVFPQFTAFSFFHSANFHFQWSLSGWIIFEKVFEKKVNSGTLENDTKGNNFLALFEEMSLL